MLSAITTLAVALLPLLGAAEARSRDHRRGLKPIKLTHNNMKRATWTVANDYSGDSFFDGFTYFTDADPTAGNVNYVQDSSLAYVNSAGNAIMKVDNTSTVAAGGNRDSIRITSTATLSEGSMVILTAPHYPYGCSVWPAFWLLGPSWPADGEVDVFEGVNGNTNNQMTLHTSPGCTHDASASETGTILATDCDTSVNGNSGCGIQDPSSSSYGAGAAGQVLATVWTADGISVWSFASGSVPTDITSGSPDPTSWGTATAAWPFTNGDCASSFFTDLSVVFDITLCGAWAGSTDVYPLTCSGTCTDAIATATNYDEAYWEVSSVVTYTSS